MLIPVFKKITLEEIDEKQTIGYGLSEWVMIKFPYEVVKRLSSPEWLDDYEEDDDIEFETNRVEVEFEDEKDGEVGRFKLYLYFNESMDEMIAYDSHMEDPKGKVVEFGDVKFCEIIKK